MKRIVIKLEYFPRFSIIFLLNEMNKKISCADIKKKMCIVGLLFENTVWIRIWSAEWNPYSRYKIPYRFSIIDYIF